MSRQAHPRAGLLTLALLLGSAAVAHASDTPIYTIQGSERTSPLAGQTVTTIGVVTQLLNNGFYLQDPQGDGNPLTSDGIFVFTGTVPTVATGQWLRLTGRVSEFNVGAAGNAVTAANPVTQLGGISGLAVLSSGHSVTPVEVVLPESVEGELERYEGMLVTLRGPLTVSQNYFLGRFGQLTLSAGGRLEVPTNRHRPGAEAQALADENARRRIVLDDGTSQQNPNPTPYLAADQTVRAGDVVERITGVIDYGLATASNTGWGDYKIQPAAPVVFRRANPRSTVPPAVHGNLKLASFNVLNYFTTFTNGHTADGRTGEGCSLGGSVSASHCRGANHLAEFQRQQAKIVAALAAIDADAVGLIEMQNNGPTAVQNLVDALNAQVGAGTYAAVPDPVGGTGTDAIKLAIIYKPAKLQRVGIASADISPVHNRPPLAQTFALPNGERFSLVVNHFKSKSCGEASGADADQGDGQGCWNATRLQQAAALRSFVARVQQAAGSHDVLIVGDLNAYAKEDPVVELTGGGFVDLIARYQRFGYSYVFDGAAGRLDHALATPSMAARATGATEWHINADEPLVLDYNVEFRQPVCGSCPPDLYAPTPYRSSDHDPVIAGFAVYKTLYGTPGRDRLSGTPGDDWFVGGAGADSLSGRGGRNIFAYLSPRDAGDVITDFVPGQDRLDLRVLLARVGHAGSDAFEQGVVRLGDGHDGTRVQIDGDGPGPAAARTLVTLRGVAASALRPARDFMLR